MRSSLRLLPMVAFAGLGLSGAAASCAKAEDPGWRTQFQGNGGQGGGVAKGGASGAGGSAHGGSSGAGGTAQGGSGTGGTSKGGSGTGGSGTGGSGTGGSGGGGGCAGACTQCVEIQTWYGFSDPYAYMCSDCIDMSCASQLSNATNSCPANFNDPCINSCSSDNTCFCSCMVGLSGACGPAVASVYACIYASCKAACM